MFAFAHTYIYIYNARLYILLVAQVVDEDAQSSGYHFVTNLISVINFLSTMQLAQCAHLVYFSDFCVCVCACLSTFGSDNHFRG